MRAGGLTERYVKALSGMELPKGLTLKTLHQQISAFAQTYEQGDELREILENPFFGDAERKRVIELAGVKGTLDEPKVNLSSKTVRAWVGGYSGRQVRDKYQDKLDEKLGKELGNEVGDLVEGLFGGKR